MTTNKHNVHPVFRDPDLDRRFRVDGFVTVPFLDQQGIGELCRRLDALDLWGASGFHDTASAGLGFDQRREVHDVLCDAFAVGADDLLHGYRPVMSSLLTKWPGLGSEKEIHRDFRLVDESRFRSVCIWVPLVDVDERNGALAVLPGSHLVDTGPRSVPTTPDRPRDPVPELGFDDLATVPLAAGHAVVFDMAAAHGSPDNLAEHPRTAVAVAYAPQDAILSLLFCGSDGGIEELLVDDPDEFRRIDWRVRPSGLQSLGTVEVMDREVPVTELIVRSREISGRTR